MGTLSINPPPGWRTVCGGGRGWLRDVWCLPSHQRDRDVCHQHLQYRHHHHHYLNMTRQETFYAKRRGLCLDSLEISCDSELPGCESGHSSCYFVIWWFEDDHQTLKMIIRLWRWSSDHDYRSCLPWGKVRPYGLPGGSDQQDQVQRPRLLQGSCVGCGNNDDGADENIRLIVILMYTVKIRKILCDTQAKHIPNTNLISSRMRILPWSYSSIIVCLKDRFCFRGGILARSVVRTSMQKATMQRRG